MNARTLAIAACLMALLVLGPVASAAITETKESLNFTYKYEFDSEPPAGELYPFNYGSEGVAPVVSGGVVTFTSGAESSGSNYESDGSLAHGNGIWQTAGIQGSLGYTVEVRVKVLSQAGLPDEAATQISTSTNDAGGQVSSFVNVRAAGQQWYFSNQSTFKDLGTEDNTDDYHIFRLALDPATQEFSVWRDGVLLDSTLPDVYAGSQTTLSRIWIGDWSGAVGGSASYDYLRFTPGAFAPVPTLVPGDFDSDGDVDGADFVAWQTNFPTASGATLAQGDADADGDVDGADFVVWQTNFPTTPGPGANVVPEPNALLVAIMLGLTAATRRWRHCR